jgi:hypothetical protein
VRDLFDIFPDLPCARSRPLASRLEAIRRQVEETRRRGRANVVRQKAAARAVRERLERRRRA